MKLTIHTLNSALLAESPEGLTAPRELGGFRPLKEML